ncbi:hypothetical protein CXU21_02965 [Akkermansia muciniphila]|nr:hypothetical protein CXU21_02965 [Akkermansia muciniphila]
MLKYKKGLLPERNGTGGMKHARATRKGLPERRRERTLFAGRGLEAGGLRFCGDPGGFDMKEFPYSLAPTALRHREVNDVVSQIIGIQAGDTVRRSKRFRRVRQFFTSLEEARA